MDKKDLPFLCQIMVCVNDREGSRASCADGGKGPSIQQLLKARAKAMGWDKTKVRVARTLCFGLCAEGPNVVIHPQNIWFSHVTVDDVETIISTVDELYQASLIPSK